MFTYSLLILSWVLFLGIKPDWFGLIMEVMTKDSCLASIVPRILISQFRSAIGMTCISLHPYQDWASLSIKASFIEAGKVIFIYFLKCCMLNLCKHFTVTVVLFQLVVHQARGFLCSE